MKILIIGAGQAGLATSYYLQQAGLPHQVLEALPRIGDQWRSRWRSLRLFSPAEFNNLPGLPFPAPAGALPTRLEAADYLENYAHHFQLPVRTGVSVLQVTHNGNGFSVQTAEEVFSADQLVIATGAYQTPYRPPLHQCLSTDVYQLHSRDYFQPEQLPPGPVLVVGAGASGVQIARELSAQHEVFLAGRDTGNLPRTFLGLDVYWWLYHSCAMTLRVDRFPGNWLHRRGLATGDLRVGENLDDLVEQYKFQRRGRLVRVEGATFHFDDNQQLTDVTTVIWATGYRNDYSWLPPNAVDEKGRPRQQRGMSTTLPGLYFMGLPYLQRINSALMGGVGRDAAVVVREMRKVFPFQI